MIWLIPLLHGLGHLTFPIGKALVAYADPIFTVGVRMLLSGFFLLGGLLLKGFESIKISLKEAISLLILSLLGIYFNNLCEYLSLKYLTTAKTCFFYSMSPCICVFISCLMSYIFLKERMTIKKWVGVIVSMAGFLPILMIQNSSQAPFKIDVLFSWPSIAAIAGSFCGVNGWILMRLLLKDQKMCLVKINGYTMLFGGLLALITSFFIEKSPIDQWVNLDYKPYFGWMILIILLSNIICSNLYGYLLKKFSETLISFFSLFSPLYTSLYAHLFYGVPFHPFILLSTAFVTIGLIIVYRIEVKQGYVLTLKTSHATS